MLGVEPWLNETTACTFPEPYISDSRRSVQYNFNDYDPESGTDTGRKPNVESDKVESLASFNVYEGIFGNFAYGNITVNIPQFCSELDMNRKTKIGQILQNEMWV